MLPVDYQPLAESFIKQSIDVSVSEFQGLLLGLIISLPAVSARRTEIQTLLAPKLGWNETLNDIIEGLFVWHETYLANRPLVLPLYLPPDDTPLVGRVRALAELAGGLLSGLAFLTPPHSKSLEVQEILADIKSVSEIGLGKADTDPESAERDYCEIVEYLKVAVLLLQSSVTNLAH